jgi:putative phosphoribosyl transferase
MGAAAATSASETSPLRTLQRGGYATLLLDLLTREEDVIDHQTREYRFDVDRLSHRIVAAIDWAASYPTLAPLRVACFGASTGAAAALVAAAERPDSVRAVISRGVDDAPVIELNRAAMRRMRAHVQLEIVPGATHLFEEPGALEVVSQLALRWCTKYLDGPSG